MSMEPPVKPQESDCCNSGCNPCILDVYEEHLKKFNSSNKIQHQPKSSCLSLTSFSLFKLINVEPHTKDCNLYTFQYNQTSDLSECSTVLYQPGQYLILKGQWQGKTIQRSYTPLYIENQPENQFTVLVKLYETGQMSQYFRTMAPGVDTLWRGPYGDYKVNYSLKSLFFIAQGTGIAPFYTIIYDILKNEDCYTFLKLFYCCAVDNCLLRDKLYKLQQYWNFKYELFIGNLCVPKDFLEKYEEKVHYRRLDQSDLVDGIVENCTKEQSAILICGSDSFSQNLKVLLLKCRVIDTVITVF